MLSHSKSQLKNVLDTTVSFYKNNDYKDSVIALYRVSVCEKGSLFSYDFASRREKYDLAAFQAAWAA